MTDDDGQQGIRGRLGRGKAAVRRRAGDPNVLSDAAVPNELSTQAKPPAAVAIGTRPGVQGTPATTRPGYGATPAPAPGRTVPENDAPAEGRRLPAIPTLIFLGFVGLTAFRLVGEFLGESAADPTAAPVATTVAPGPVRFGTALDDECNPTGEAESFAESTEVWWAAEMATRMKASVTVVVIIRLEGKEIEREVIPPDSSTASWQVLCGWPIDDGDAGAGAYRVEVWSQDETVLHSAGDVTVAPGSS